jgi:hypothetical protein
MKEVGALIEEAKSAGVWVFKGGLHSPETSTVLIARGDDVLMTDGPYLEGKEHIGGFLIIDVLTSMPRSSGGARPPAWCICPSRFTPSRTRERADAGRRDHLPAWR